MAPPSPFGAIPSPRQLVWHSMETYGFLHFTTNTFTDLEWGYGDENPSVFQPSELDCSQWARVAKDGGLKGLILTCKHHDGFCLWPSQFTEHSVKYSPWQGGQGDVVRELSRACKAFDLKLGVYLSPWDRNHSLYGQSEYVTYYRDQLRELLTRYGPIFEVWHDGANGGDGWYGGACETRKIDPATYYSWPETWAMIRQTQPDAVIFSDAGADIRWVGNETGIGSETTWCTFNPAGRYPGYPAGEDQGMGHEGGTDWVPPETDVSIRPGWFYHMHEDTQVKRPEQLVDIYFQSVGRGTSLLLNLPPDRCGLIHEIDSSHLHEFHRIIVHTFQNDLALGATVTAMHTRGEGFAASNLVDGNPETYWSTDDKTTKSEVRFEFAKPITFNVVQLMETIFLGQRVRRWRFEVKSPDSTWQPVAAGTTIGYKRLARFSPIQAETVRLCLDSCLACPVLTSFSLFFNPELQSVDRSGRN